MQRNVSHNGLINWLALLGAGVGLQLVAQASRSSTAAIGVAFLALGFLVSLVSWFQMRLEAREETERLEMEDLARSKSGSALFEGSSEDAFHARRARQQFEKWFVPGVTLLLFLLECVAVYWFYSSFNEAGPAVGSPAAWAMAALAGMGLALFLIGNYAARLARYEEIRLLRPSASSLLMGAVICGIATLTEVADYFGYPRYDRVAAWLLLAVLAVVAVEKLLGLVMEIYRPRVKGKAGRLVYESRLIGMFGSSGGLFKTAAHALDYQFGFKVSETWFYKFLEDHIGRLALFWLGLLWLGSCLVFVEPHEQGLLERFGRPVAGRVVLSPGMHFKLPWPIDSVHRIAAQQLQTFSIGYEPDPEKEKERTVLWTVPHYKSEFNLLVASRERMGDGTTGGQAVPVNLLGVSIPVQFYIQDIQKWTYQHADAAALLQRIASREVTRYLVSVDMDQIMSFGRFDAARELRDRIQKLADTHQLGVHISFVGLQDIHPPQGNKEAQVAAAYEQVIGAEAQKEARILEAEGYAAETLPRAQSELVKRVNDARAKAATALEDARAQADKFDSQRKAFRTAPTVFRERVYLDTLVRSTANSRKIVVVPTNSHDVIQLNLEDKIRPDLLDVNIENPNKPKENK